MAMYSYRDEERKLEIYAKNAHSEDKSTRFYCPDPDCKAHMFICGLDGSSAAYFRATLKKYPHKIGCSFGSSNNFNPDEHDEDSFDFEEAMQNLEETTKPVGKNDTPNPHSVGTTKGKPLHTIRQIYDMCKSYKCSDKYNNLKIGFMLLDDRSSYMYTKGIFGYKLIEAKIKRYFYDKNSLTITLCTPIKTTKYKLILKVEDNELFNEMRDKLYNNRNKIVLVSGNWKFANEIDSFTATISSKKQYHVIKK